MAQVMVMRIEASQRNGMENLWCSPSPTPVRPDDEKGRRRQGAYRESVVICPMRDAWAITVGEIPNILAVSATTGMTPK